jgi:hypothetical protein
MYGGNILADLKVDVAGFRNFVRITRTDFEGLLKITGQTNSNQVVNSQPTFRGPCYKF